MDKLKIRLAIWPAYCVNGKVKTRTQFSQKSSVLFPQYYPHTTFCHHHCHYQQGMSFLGWWGFCREEATERGLPSSRAAMASFLPQSSQAPPCTTQTTHHEKWAFVGKVPCFECCSFFATPTFPIVPDPVEGSPTHRSLLQLPRSRILSRAKLFSGPFMNVDLSLLWGLWVSKDGTGPLGSWMVHAVF